MVTKTITYTDYKGVERTEDFLFNLNQAELIDMNREHDGGMADILRKMINTRNVIEFIGFIKEILLRSYGEVSSDGRRFVKSKELSEAFSQTEAFNKLYVELAQDANKAAEFVNSVIPADLVEEAKDYVSKHKDELGIAPGVLNAGN